MGASETEAVRRDRPGRRARAPGAGPRCGLGVDRRAGHDDDGAVKDTARDAAERAAEPAEPPGSDGDLLGVAELCHLGECLGDRAVDELGLDVDVTERQARDVVEGPRRALPARSRTYRASPVRCQLGGVDGDDRPALAGARGGGLEGACASVEPS